jgi:formate dehydrogenase iron-sulfur subunit
MAGVSRRKFFATAGAAAGAALVPSRAEAAVTDVRSFDHAQAKLYDATRCIGCRSCMRACRQINKLPPDPVEIDGVNYDFPRRLSANNWMVIEAYRAKSEASTEGESQWSFIKKNCMHCNIPACASACPVAALEKTEDGPVLYHEDRCIGCRYCLLACPFQVPRYEWVEAKPRVRKCTFKLACVEACPVGALQTGNRRELLEEAHHRIHEHPDRYVDHVYGEFEAGGTSYLILSGLPLEELGLPDLPATTRSHYADAILGSLPGLIIGMGLFLGGLYQLEKRQREAKEDVGGEPLTSLTQDRDNDSQRPTSIDD